jgi:mono/diheme cytochrome c family protein
MFDSRPCTLALLVTAIAAGSCPAAADSPQPRRLDASKATLREGRRLYLESGCMSCHSLGGAGGNTAPALDAIGSRRTKAFIEAKIRDPQAHPDLKSSVSKKSKPKSKMIQADLFDNQVKALATYLYSLKAPRKAPRKGR